MQIRDVSRTPEVVAIATVRKTKISVESSTESELLASLSKVSGNDAITCVAGFNVADARVLPTGANLKSPPHLTYLFHISSL